MDTEFCYNIKRSLESDIQNDKECKRMTEFLNACQQKGLTKSDIDKYYYLWNLNSLVKYNVLSIVTSFVDIIHIRLVRKQMFC